MVKGTLQQIIKQCVSKTMSIQQIQLTILKFANHILDTQQQNKNKPQNSTKQNLSQKSPPIQQIDKNFQKFIESKQKQIQQIQNKIQILNKNINNINQKLTQQNKINLQILQKIQNKQPISLTKKIQQFQTKKKTNTNKNIDQFYKLQKCTNKFKFNGQSLTKISDDNTWHQFIFHHQILHQNQFNFKIKINKSKYLDIIIGILDYDQQKEQQHSSISKNAISYDIFNKVKHPGAIKQGNGVVQGETVEVKVNRKTNTISWIVNDVQRASYTHQMLKEKDRKFMPFVQMCNTGDIIEYIL